MGCIVRGEAYTKTRRAFGDAVFALRFGLLHRVLNGSNARILVRPEAESSFASGLRVGSLRVPGPGEAIGVSVS